MKCHNFCFSVIILTMNFGNDEVSNKSQSGIFHNQDSQQNYGFFNASGVMLRPPHQYLLPLDEVLDLGFNFKNQTLHKDSEHKNWGINGKNLEGTSSMISEFQDFQNPLAIPHKSLKEHFEQRQIEEEQNEFLSPNCSPAIYEDEESNKKEGVCVKNETKNIPKNFGKAVISFVSNYRNDIEPILQSFCVSYEEFSEQLHKVKKQINTICNLRNLWLNFKFAKCMRMISNRFFRKHSLNYIFNSRISNFATHIKYRKRLQQAVQNPEEFKHIKEY